MSRGLRRRELLAKVFHLFFAGLATHLHFVFAIFYGPMKRIWYSNFVTCGCHLPLLFMNESRLMTLSLDGRRIRHTAEKAIDSRIWLRLGYHSQSPREVHLK